MNRLRRLAGWRIRIYTAADPGRDAAVPAENLAGVLAIWVATLLAAMPAGTGEAILHAAGLRAATGQHGTSPDGDQP